MNMLYNYAFTIIKQETPLKICHCVEKNVKNALTKWKVNKNSFFHDGITEIFRLSMKQEFNNLSEKTLNEIKIILYVLDIQIENNIFFPCFLMKYYGLDYDQSCVIINCLYMMDFCTHDISLKYPLITLKGKKMLDFKENDYNFVSNWLNKNICTINEFSRLEDDEIHYELV